MSLITNEIIEGYNGNQSVQISWEINEVTDVVSVYDQGCTVVGHDNEGNEYFSHGLISCEVLISVHTDVEFITPFTI